MSTEKQSREELLQTIKSQQLADKAGSIIVNDTVHSVNEVQMAALTQDAENCEQLSCYDHPTARDFCRDEGWPPDHRVLICTRDGYCCYCYRA